MSAPPSGPDAVRLAWPAEAAVIAAIQRRSWSQVLPRQGEVLLELTTLDEMSAIWHRAITMPPRAEHRVLVATTGDGRVAGFAVTGPSDDSDAVATDGAIQVLVIDPPAQRRGHGSRLLNACVDTLRSDGFERAHCWVATDHDALRLLLTRAGWAADGAWREIGADEAEEAAQLRVRELRLHTDIRTT